MGTPTGGYVGFIELQNAAAHGGSCVSDVGAWVSDWAVYRSNRKCAIGGVEILKNG